MKISTEIGSMAKIVSEERAIEYIAKAGFDAWDFSMFRMCKFDRETREPTFFGHPLSGSDYLKFARRLGQIGGDFGIHCNQAHAPFPTVAPQVYPYLQRAIECTAEAGGKICIIHPDNFLSAEENAKIYLQLLPFAKEYGVKIAAENMWGWNKKRDEASSAACSHHDDFKAHLDAVNDEYFVACLDIGHAEMRGLGMTAVQMIHTLGDKLSALHIHDNDKWHDSHELPYSMNIEFEPIIKALHDIGYKGYFTLEADTYLSNAGYTAENVFSGIKNMASVARKMANFFDNL